MFWLNYTLNQIGRQIKAHWKSRHTTRGLWRTAIDELLCCCCCCAQSTMQFGVCTPQCTVQSCVNDWICTSPSWRKLCSQHKPVANVKRFKRASGNAMWHKYDDDDGSIVCWWIDRSVEKCFHFDTHGKRAVEYLTFSIKATNSSRHTIDIFKWNILVCRLFFLKLFFRHSSTMLLRVRIYFQLLNMHFVCK